MTRTVIKQGTQIDLQDPLRISMVDKPATRTPFKVIRSESAVAAKTSKDGNKVVMVEFAPGTTEEAANTVLTAMGVSLVKQTSESEEAAVVMLKDGVTEEEARGKTKVDLVDGVSVFFDISIGATRSETGITGVTLTGLEFPATWEVTRVEEWLSDKSITYLDAASYSDDDTHHVVIRSEIPQGAELKTIAISDEVKAIIHRSEGNDVPVALVNSVVEASYGSYGWGIMDFNQYMANENFRDGYYDASWAFRDVMENILLYSDLSIDERVALIQNAIKSYSAYLLSLLQSLPKGVAVAPAPANTDTTQRSEKMLKNKTVPAAETHATSEEGAAAAASGTTETKPAETANTEVAAGTTDTAAAETATTDNAAVEGTDDAGVTRAEVQRMITEATASLADTIAAKVGETMKTEVATAISRAEQVNNETINGLKATLGDMQKAVDDLGGTVVVRGDALQQSGKQDVMPAPVKDVFSGLFDQVKNH